MYRVGFLNVTFSVLSLFGGGGVRESSSDEERGDAWVRRREEEEEEDGVLVVFWGFGLLLRVLGDVAGRRMEE